MHNADFALRYAEKQYTKFTAQVGDNAHVYLESVVQHHLGNDLMDDDPATELELEKYCCSLDLCQQIVANSVGVEDRWTTIEKFRSKIAQVKRWISDVECEVLADSLELAHSSGYLMYQK